MSPITNSNQLNQLMNSTMIYAVIVGLVAVLVVLAVANMFPWEGGSDKSYVKRRIAFIVIGLFVIVIGIAIACILDRDAGAFECPECKSRFVPEMGAYIMGPHTITKRKLVCPHCGAHKYCKKVLTK